MSVKYDFSALPGKVVIGITGPIAGGKSHALKCFSKYGAEIISADDINRKILSDPDIFVIIYDRYEERLGPDKNGFDKKMLAEIVFSDAEERKWLEDLLHPLILEKSFIIASKSEKKLIAIEFPLLFEAGLRNNFSLTLCINVSERNLKERIAERGWSEEHYEKRTAGQFSLQKKCSMSDLIIQNDGTPEELEEKIRKICNAFLM